MSSLHTPLIFHVCVWWWWGGGGEGTTLFLSHPVDAKTLLVFTVNYNSDWLAVLPGSTIPTRPNYAPAPPPPPPPSPPTPPHILTSAYPQRIRYSPAAVSVSLQGSFSSHKSCSSANMAQRKNPTSSLLSFPGWWGWEWGWSGGGGGATEGRE